MSDLARAQLALQAYALSDAVLEPITTGNINLTYLVRAGAQRFVLQRLNPIFRPEVHHDIARVTEVLSGAGLVTPTLVRTRDGALWTEPQAREVWRLQTFIPGRVYSRAESPGLCHAAGLLLGRFHAALSGLQHTFRAPRLGVHDTPKHLRALRDALQAHPEHVAFTQAQPLAQAILSQAAHLPSMLELPSRTVHGDPKINNMIFSEAGEGVALIDLDTLGHMPVTLELGDALRSWCNTAGEDAPEGTFCLPHFVAAMRGYAAGAGPSLQPEELALLPAALETIALELAARFARDVLEESYFGWDRQRYAAAWQHHLVRAQSQLTLAQSYRAQRAAAEAALREVFAT